MNDILYICNKKKCEICAPNCSGTTDIAYAKNFIRVGDDTYIEKKKKERKKK